MISPCVKCGAVEMDVQLCLKCEEEWRCWRCCIIERCNEGIATFKEFAELKSGRDQFSRMGIRDLAKHVSESDYEEVIQAGFEEKDVAAALRWVLRGLTARVAIRKIQVGHEIARNALGGKRAEEGDWRDDVFGS
jgi:hypothetical protein